MNTKEDFQRQSKIALGIFFSAVAVFFAASLVVETVPTVGWAILVAIPVAIVSWFTVATTYALSKGYSIYLGILGLANVFGLIAVALLPDRWATR